MSADTVKLYNSSHKISTAFFNADAAAPHYTTLHYNAFEKIIITDALTKNAYGEAVLNNYNDLVNNALHFKFSQLQNNFFNFSISQPINRTNDIKFDETYVITNIHTVPASEIESKLVIEFEDSFFGTLKSKTIDTPQQVARYRSGTPSDLIRNILTDYNNSSQTNISDTWTTTSGNAEFNVKPNMCVEELVDHLQLYNYTTQSGNYVDAVSNILAKDVEAIANSSSKWSFTPVNAPFLKLYSKLQNNVGNIDLSDVVLESFAEGGANVDNTKIGYVRGYSEIKDLQILRPDPKIVRDTYRNIIIESTDDSNNFLIDTLPIQRTFESFYRLFCNNPNYQLDIPFNPEAQLSVADTNVNAQRISALYPSLEPGSTQALLYNTILFNSTTLKFKVKGQIYRKSGYFIHFEPRQAINDDPHYKQYAGFWFITEVQHIFKGNTYDNIITCVNPFIRKY